MRVECAMAVDAGVKDKVTGTNSLLLACSIV